MFTIYQIIFIILKNDYALFTFILYTKINKNMKSRRT